MPVNCELVDHEPTRTRIKPSVRSSLGHQIHAYYKPILWPESTLGIMARDRCARI